MRNLLFLTDLLLCPGRNFITTVKSKVKLHQGQSSVQFVLPLTESQQEKVLQKQRKKNPTRTVRLRLSTMSSAGRIGQDKQHLCENHV